MASLAAVFILVMFSIVYSSCVATEYNIFCQYDMNSVYYKNTSQFYDWHIDSRLCTHLVLGSGTGVDEKSGALSITNKALLENSIMSEAKRYRYESIQKVLISVGGFEEESRAFSRMVASAAKRDKFYASLVDFMFKMGYDGVQIDWRYPTQRGGQPEDKKNFVRFLEELGMIFRNQKLILMVAVLGRTDAQTLASYDIPGITRNVNFINLMVDDERDKYGMRLSYVAPLHGNTNSVAAAIRHWKKAGQAPEKLILHVPLFGRSYTMDRNQATVGSPCKGPGIQARNSRRAGFTTYNEYCTQASKWSKHFDKVAKVPYATSGDQWLSYEDSESIWAKMHLLKKMKLGGAMAWSIDADDFYGRCGIRYALLNVIFAALGDPSALTTESPTTEAPGICPRDGFARDPWDCRFYHECRQGERVDYECLEGQYFDVAKEYCRPAAEVKCNQDFIIWRPGMPGYNYDNLPLNLKVVED